jgi:hypothetical protein
MKIYLTKKPHTKYGTIKLSTYNTIEDLIDNSLFWFDKPSFEKPLKCIFTGEFFWRGFDAKLSGTECKIKHFPDGEVKEKMKDVIRNSIREDFYETLYNRHYKWIGEIEVDLIERDCAGNFNLYLTKPSVDSIKFAGMDRFKLWIDYPILKTSDSDNAYFNVIHRYFYGNAFIIGKFFRKNKEVEEIGMKFWDAVVDSFDIEFENNIDFYQKISDKNHKKNMSSLEFIKEFYFDIKLK